MNGALAPLLLAPALGAALTMVTRGVVRAVVGVLVASLTTLAALRLAGSVLAAGAADRLVLEGPFDIEVVLVADGLATAMLAMTAVITLAVGAFALGEDLRGPGRRHDAYWPLLFALVTGLQVLFLAGDLLTAYLMLELVGVCGAVLVTLRGDRGSLLAGARYYYAELAASTTTLIGIALVWSQAGTVAFEGLGAELTDAPIGLVGLALICVGLLLKVPLSPLHFWLPAAHTLAPSAVSPVLSAVMVKAAFAVLIRVWFLGAPELVTREAALLLGVLGVVAILWGSAIALRADGLKQLIAASTIAQLGMLFLLPPLVSRGASEGWTGGVFLAVAHAPAKAAMLMAAAVIVDSTRRAGVPATVGAGERPGSLAPDQGETTWPVLESLRGSAVRRPVAMMAFGLAGLSLIGLPPTGGFVAKWYLLLGSVATGQWWWVLAIVVGTLLTAAYLMRFVRPALAPPDAPTAAERDLRDLVALALAGTTVLLGLHPRPLIDLLQVGGPLGGG